MRLMLLFRKKGFYIFCIFPLIFLFGCNKLVQIPLPLNSITSEVTFSTDASATAAMLGIYSGMENGQIFSDFQTTYSAGRSADELTNGSGMFDPYIGNKLSPLINSNDILSNLWAPAYSYIYDANSILTGLESSTGVSPATRSQLTGEAEFIRAFCYFYLTNLFGELPLVLSTDFNKTATLAKVPQAQIYQQIIADLVDAQSKMISDFSLSGGEPIRANKWAATALLARVYLYQKNWAGADSAATAVINSGMFRLVDSPDSVFYANSNEAILQLLPYDQYPYSTQEAQFFIPFRSYFTPNSWLTTQLLAAFEPGDLRRSDWVDSAQQIYFYPYKYKLVIGQSGTPTEPPAEDYMLLRLAEQYLIRAEAEANLGMMAAAASDLNTIRARAGLGSSPTLSATATLQQADSAIQQENRIEFFAEWGHRWFDLKRWGIALQTLDTIPIKAAIDSTQLLYPIPFNETQVDPNLTQNPGYTQ